MSTVYSSEKLHPLSQFSAIICAVKGGFNLKNFCHNNTTKVKKHNLIFGFYNKNFGLVFFAQKIAVTLFGYKQHFANLYKSSLLRGQFSLFSS